MRHGVAILGCGIGAQHLAGYLALPDRFAVRVLCDRDTTRARDLARAQGLEGVRITAEVAEAMADPEVTIVDVCLPPMLHVPTAEAALAAGRHVILEKPIAPSLAQADRLARAAAAAGRQVFPVFQYRYGAGLERLAALQAAGHAGTPLVATLETHWNRDAAYYAVPWRGRWATELGGAILSHAIHIHDLIARAFGPVTAVSAMLATRANPIETEDCAALIFETASGGLVTSSVTLGAADDSSRLRLVFDGLTVESDRIPYAPGTGAWRFAARPAARQPEIDAALAALPAPGPEGFAGYLHAVAEALDGRPGREVTLAEGVASIELVSAIYHAARTGARVALPLDRALPICAGWLPDTPAAKG